MKRTEIIAIYNLLKSKFFKKKVPLIIGWSLTNRCNWRCTYCTHWDNPSEELTTEQIYFILDELSEMGTYSINFTGGEPLLRDDIGSIIYYAKIKGINVTISTNGSLVSQKIEEIREADSLIISYDGPEEIHNKQRQKGTYQSVVDAIAIAKKYNIFVKLHTVLTQHNIDYINSILNFARRFDIRVNFSVVEFTPFSKEEKIRALLPSQDKYKSTFEQLTSEKRKNSKNISNSFSSLEYFQKWPKYMKIKCCAGRIYCRIEPNGNIFPCGNLILKSRFCSCSSKGFRNAFGNLQLGDCKSCWCDTRIEMNYIYALNLKTILEIKKSHNL